jgi:hypothetical protein
MVLPLLTSLSNSYGERGIAIAFAVLRRLYACHARDTLWGFPFLKFVERVLIPEVATLLIQDDFGLDSGLLKDRNAALKIKDDSTVYGNMQYPYEDADDADG